MKVVTSYIIIHNVSISCFQAPPGHASLMSAGWGRLSSAILVQDWDTALEELNKLRRDIDESVSCPIKYRVPVRINQDVGIYAL